MKEIVAPGIGLVLTSAHQSTILGRRFLAGTVEEQTVGQ
jgi:hypothetical protein